MFQGAHLTADEMADLHITTDGNRIRIAGELRLKDVRHVLATAHRLVTVSGYRDFELDFSECRAVFPAPALMLAAASERYLQDGVDVDLILPRERRLQRLFVNANWAHLLDPQHYEPSSFRGTSQLPASRYVSGDEQFQTVNRVINRVLSALSGFDRSHLKAIEWSLNEITDNVLNHSKSPIGGLVQVTNFTTRRSSIEFCVCDAGIGIPQSLKSGGLQVPSDAEALDSAIREGVTRDKSLGQGNGLYGTWRITQLSGGAFEIHSGFASLVSRRSDLRIKPETIPFNGTLVLASIDYTQPLALENVLTFRGRPFDPADMVEHNYETEDGALLVRLGAESEGFGSRTAGLPIRNKLKNLVRVGNGKRIVVDFTDVPIISSSFADEVFGKLFVELGPLDFMRYFELRRVDSTIKALIDRAIEQRTRTGL
jgi:hypothetical protein